ncbi:MAG: methionine--tRNA ligase subunit beta [Candidatus Aenigmarchaeota archaeon]|nr:methionine--tRNA ligase subunit beta [Candidatus Aenigmarchaeota archaeon]
MISIDDFKKVELRVGFVESVEEIKGSKKLYKLKVNFGEETRQIVSGIKEYYNPEELQGKQFVFVTNLEPAKLMGEISEGMILAAVDKGILSLIKPEKNVSNGTKLS